MKNLLEAWRIEAEQRYLLDEDEVDASDLIRECQKIARDRRSDDAEAS